MKISPLSVLAMEAVQQNGMALEYASADQRETFEILFAAVQQNGMALEFAFNQWESVVLGAVKQNGLSLRFAKVFCSNIDIVQSAVLSRTPGSEARRLVLRSKKATRRVAESIEDTQSWCSKSCDLIVTCLAIWKDFATEGKLSKGTAVNCHFFGAKPGWFP